MAWFFDNYQISLITLIVPKTALLHEQKHKSKGRGEEGMQTLYYRFQALQVTLN